MTIKENGLLQKISDGQDKLAENVQSIHRAIYGDEANLVKGLLQRQDEDEKTHEEIKAKLEPIWRIHSFITSGKLWAVATALGTIIAALIHYDIIKI